MSTLLSSTPAADGFHMPGEHEPQAEVWMAWPERADNWRDGAGPAQAAFAAVAKAIAEETPVTMTATATQFARARAALPDHIRVLEIPSDDSWMRDIGPSFQVNGAGERRGVDWIFNSWGGELDGIYQPWDQDDAMAARVCEANGDDYYRAPIVLEGGAIHVDGEGTLYTTAECLLHPSRNPDLSQQEIEQALKDYTGCEKVIWIPRGLYDDETNGHVDNLVHVARPGEVILSWCEDESDPQYEISQEAYRALSQATDARGRSITIHKIHIPGPLYFTAEEAAGIEQGAHLARPENVRLAGSYANFLITNSRVVFPLLDPDRDGEAQAVLEQVFPDHEVVGVPGREILLGGGNIHCITQQVPAV